MSKDKDILNRLGANLAESMGANRNARPGTAAAPAAGPSRHDGCSRLRAAAEIEVGRIVPDPNQPRTEFDPESIARLAESLKSHGQLQPIVVRWSEDLARYVIVTGERRWRAAVEAGRPSIACIILDGEQTASEILEMQLIENALREDLKPVEQARAYRTLMDRNEWTALRLSEVLHVNCATVTRALALLDLPGSVQAAVEQGDLSPSTAYEVSKVDDPEAQREIAERVVSEGLSRSETIAAVKRAVSARPARAKGRGAAKGKPRKVTEKVFRRDGYKVMVECRRGIDPRGLVSALEGALDEARAEMPPDADAGQGGPLAAA